MISVGGKRICVQITYRGDNDSQLAHLGTEDGGCELTGNNIGSDDPVTMTHLAVTFFKKKYQNVHHLYVLDSSKIKCQLDDTKTKSMSLMKTNLLFKGKTYYQETFNAVPRYPTTTLDQFVENLDNPEYKPPIFSFSNPSLDNLLTPLYSQANTWKEFFKRIETTYGQEKCKYIYTWYLNAMYTIVHEPIPEFWKIDITTFPTIEYTDLRLGGTRKRGKQRQEYVLDDPVIFWDRHDTYDIKFI
jgi:hypothetical protein